MTHKGARLNYELILVVLADLALWTAIIQVLKAIL
jgi:hypothetical protein